jgi:hypothetical protein
VLAHTSKPELSPAASYLNFLPSSANALTYQLSEIITLFKQTHVKK